MWYHDGVEESEVLGLLLRRDHLRLTGLRGVVVLQLEVRRKGSDRQMERWKTHKMMELLHDAHCGQRRRYVRAGG